MAKKLTITDILAQKEAAKNKKLATRCLYVESLDAEIMIQEPTKALMIEAVGLGDQSDNHIIYHCMIEPNIKAEHQSLMKHFGCATPYEIVDCLFKAGEIPAIAQNIAELAGYGLNGSRVRIVNEVKN